MINKHPYIAAMMLAGLIASWGYVETKLYPKAPAIACMSWVWALLIVVAGIAMAPGIGSLGLALGAITFVAGSALILFYYNTHNKAGTD